MSADVLEGSVGGLPSVDVLEGLAGELSSVDVAEGLAGDREAAGSAAESPADPAAERVSLEDMRNCSSLFLQTNLVSWRVTKEVK